MSFREPSSSDLKTKSSRPMSKKLSILTFLFPYLKKYMPVVVCALVSLFVASGSVLFIGHGIRHLVDQGFLGETTDALDHAVMVFGGLIVVLAIASYARYFLVSWVGERVIADIRKDVFSKVLGLNPGFFETTKTGEIISRLTVDTSLVQTVVGTAIPIALRNAFIVFGSLAMLFLTSFKLTATLFLIVPFILVPIIFLGKKVRGFSRNTQECLADVSAYIDESLNGIRTVQAFCHEDRSRMFFGEYVERTFDAAIQRVRQRALMIVIVLLLVFGGVCFVLWQGGHSVFLGQISSGQLVSFLFYAILMASGMASISDVYGDLQRAAGAMDRLVEILEETPEIITVEKPIDIEDSKGHLMFDKVSFSYPSLPDLPVLRDVDFTINPGEKIAVVGPSGAGKTTVFQLLLRFYDPTLGQVKFDHHNLRQLDPRALRQKIGLVAQDPMIFSTTLYENLRFAKPDATSEEIFAAADAAQMTEFVERFPDGMETFVGEKGTRLSGGQKQRVAIARAILKDPTVLLLDEATSALDAENERYVYQAFKKLMHNRTTLIIAHRLATVKKVDKILVFDKGCIVDSGTHEELISRNGVYKRLAKLQFDLEE